MALRWIEGFEGFGTTTDVDIASLLAAKYTTTGEHTLTTGFDGGFALGTGSGTLSRAVTFGTDFFVGLALKIRVNSSYQPILTIGGSSGDIVFYTSGDGVLNLKRGEDLLSTTYIPGEGYYYLEDSIWYYVEFKIHQAAGDSGTAEIWVNDVIRSQVNTGATDIGANSLTIHHPTGGAAIDDLYILDSTGADNTTFIGRLARVTTLYPNGDLTTDWTPSAAGTHYTLVNDNPDSTTTYISSGVDDAMDVFEYEHLAAGAIKGLQINTKCCAVDDPMTLAVVIKSDDTTDVSHEHSIAVGSYVTVADIISTDPDTSTAWTLTGLQNAKFGVKVIIA
jgi:hypothetical protein